MTNPALSDEDQVRAMLYVADLLPPQEAQQLRDSLPQLPALANEVERLQARQWPMENAGGLAELMHRVGAEEAWRTELLQAHPELAQRAARLWVALQEVRARAANLNQLASLAPTLPRATDDKGKL